MGVQQAENYIKMIARIKSFMTEYDTSSRKWGFGSMANRGIDVPGHNSRVSLLASQLGNWGNWDL